MAKAAHWYIQFISRTGIKRRAYIYDDYTGSVPASWPILLDANGDAPFVTDEKADGAIFDQVRTSTGSMSICTAIPGGGTITVDDLLPADNISRYVKLVNVTTSGGVETETIVWSGFLNCESLDQELIGIPEFITFNIQSTLQAADSVEIVQSNDFAFSTILTHIAYSLQSLDHQTGISLYDHIYISSRFYEIMRDKYIFSNSYFESNENVSGENVVMEVHSISVMNIIGNIAKYFGMVVREVGKDLYLTDELTTTYKQLSVTNMYNALLNNTEQLTTTDIAAQSMQISDIDWTGIDHKKDVTQGKKRVIVSAKLKDFECNLSLYDTPRDSLVENPDARQTATGSEIWANTNQQYHSHMVHKNHTVKAIFPTDLSAITLQYVTHIPSLTYQGTYFWAANQIRDNYEQLVVNQTHGSDSGIYYVIASFMALWRNADGNLQPGLMICGFPNKFYWSYNPVQLRPFTYTWQENMYLYKNTTPLIFSAIGGYLNINANVMAWFNVHGTQMAPYTVRYRALCFALQFGNKWATYNPDTLEAGWSDSFTYFNGYISTEGALQGNWNQEMPISSTSGILINLPERMTGFVSLYIFPYVDALHAGQASDFTSSYFDAMLDKLTLSYIPVGGGLRNTRSENRYVKDIKNGFKEDETISVDLATDVNNEKLASMIWDDSTTPCKLLTIDGTSMRPETDLMNRMNDFYCKTRATLKLKGEKPSSKIAPITKATDTDGKVYIPISESRDWQQDTSTITCMETPDGDS